MAIYTMESGYNVMAIDKMDVKGELAMGGAEYC